MPGSDDRPSSRRRDEVVLERDAERGRALPDLERRERVHVDAGHPVADRLDHGGVVVAVEGGMDPALQADLDRAAVPRLLRAAHDLVHRHEVRLAAQVARQPPLGEGAEAAAEVTDVRVLDVPRDDVGHLVAAYLAPEPVGGGQHREPVVTARAEQRDRVVLLERHAGGSPRERLVHARLAHARAGARVRQRRPS